MKYSRIYRNWTVHNLFAHPLSELVWLVTHREDWAGWIHDVTVPEHAPGEGRG